MDRDLQIVGGVCVAAIVIGLVIYAISRSSARHAASWKPPARQEIARIEERVSLSGLGGLSSVLLMLHNVVMAIAFFVSAKSAVQEASLGTMWIAGNVLWGVCMMMGRRSTYVVTRQIDPVDPPAA